MKEGNRMKKSFLIEGLSDVASATMIKENVGKMVGVNDVNLDLPTTLLEVEVEKENILLFKLIEYVVKKADGNLILKNQE